MTALDSMLLDPLSGAAPLAFTGSDGFEAADLLATSVEAATDAAWADRLVTGLFRDERALVSLAFAPGGAAVAHRVRPSGVGVTRCYSRYQTAAARCYPTGQRVTPAGGRATHSVAEEPSSAAYAGSVRAVLGRIADGEVEKVVLGRRLEIVSSPALDAADVVARLLDARAGRYVFSLPLGAGPRTPVLLGASPELLVRRAGDRVWSTPLAGSIPRAADPREDAARAERLQESAKDLAEHAFVVDDIVGRLAPICAEVQAPARPELMATDTLWHLATPIRARLLTGAPLSALRLAQLLQPTPALGGVPRAAALSLIDELEGDRGPFGGAVGWVDAAGDGEFAVTIRAGVLDGTRLRLFAGAGIVAGSDPASEVRETETKLMTMARAIGLDLSESGGTR